MKTRLRIFVKASLKDFEAPRRNAKEMKMSQKAFESLFASPEAKAMRDLRPLAAKRPVETLEAAEAWSICSTPQKEQLSQPSQGLELSEASRRGRQEKRRGKEVEKDLEDDIKWNMEFN